jgi:hypothetical protein
MVLLTNLYIVERGKISLSLDAHILDVIYIYCYCILSLLISMSKDKPKAIVSENLVWVVVNLESDTFDNPIFQKVV